LTESRYDERVALVKHCAEIKKLLGKVNKIERPKNKQKARKHQTNSVINFRELEKQHDFQKQNWNVVDVWNRKEEKLLPLVCLMSCSFMKSNV